MNLSKVYRTIGKFDELVSSLLNLWENGNFCWRSKRARESVQLLWCLLITNLRKLRKRLNLSYSSECLWTSYCFSSQGFKRPWSGNLNEMLCIKLKFHNLVKFHYISQTTISKINAIVLTDWRSRKPTHVSTSIVLCTTFLIEFN